MDFSSLIHRPRKDFGWFMRPIKYYMLAGNTECSCLFIFKTRHNFCPRTFLMYNIANGAGVVRFIGPTMDKIRPSWSECLIEAFYVLPQFFLWSYKQGGTVGLNKVVYVNPFDLFHMICIGSMLSKFIHCPQTMRFKWRSNPGFFRVHISHRYSLA